MTEKLKILPLGGLREVGKNCMLLIYNKEALMIDCGMGFAGNDEFMEDDFYIPDLDAIDSLDMKLTGAVVTHGHEDHIGAVPYLLKKFDIPVYMTEMPAKLLKERISKIATYDRIVALPSSRTQPFDIGPFTLRMIDVAHSIAEAKALEISVGPYKLLHTGDFKFEKKGESPFKEKVSEDIDILLMDSTNVEQDGHSGSEPDILPNIEKIIEEAPGRIIATAFSSNTIRIKNIAELSIKHGRTVALLGRSMNQYTRIAQELGHLQMPEGIITDRAKIKTVPDNKLTLIVTGSQAEPRSIMKRMSLDMLKSVTVKYGDTIFFSSKIIPGNELSISRMMDNLVEKGVNLFYENTAYIHVSGHAKRDELKQSILDVNPRLVIPVHGHIRFLDRNAKLARELGYEARMITDGDMLVYTKEKNYLQQKLDLETTIVSNYESDLVELETLRERKRTARSGFMVVLMTVDMLENELINPPTFISSGISAHGRLKKIERDVREIIYNYFNDELGEDPDWDDVEEEIRIRTRRYLTSVTRKKPIVYSTIVNKEHQ